MKPQLFIDLDGVLGDFYGYYETCFGAKPEQTESSPEFWDNIRSHGNFYREQPLLPDALELWEGAKLLHSNPIILSGIPRSIPRVADQKLRWVRQHIGPRVQLITCYSRDKWKFGQPGDILVDDRLKYISHWLGMNGIFVHHKSAKQSLAELQVLYSKPVSYRA